MAAEPTRAASRAASITLSPWFRSPRRLVSGNRAASKKRGTETAPLKPIFSSRPPQVTSGVAGISTTKALIPLAPRSGSVSAATRAKRASPPEVTKFLLPVSTQPSCSRRATLFIPPGSEPASGSVRAKQA